MNTLPPPQKTFLMSIRQALIMILGALEDYLGLERSIIPRRKRGERGHDDES